MRGKAELAEHIREQEAVIRTAMADQARSIAEMDRVGLYAEDGARSMRAWLRDALISSDREAKRRVMVAESTTPRYSTSGAPVEPEFPSTAEAVDNGTVTFENARTIIEGVRALPPGITDQQRCDVEYTLATEARAFSPHQVRVLAHRVRYLLDQDGALREEEYQVDHRELHIGVGRDGMTLRKGRLDREAGAGARPPGTSEAHHVVHWADGGPTCLENMAMLCAHHHRNVHRHGWRIAMGNGRPVFTPPKWIDSRQRPRRGGRPHTGSCCEHGGPVQGFALTAKTPYRGHRPCLTDLA